MSLDECPICARRVGDFDINGIELPNGQRWHLHHATARFIDAIRDFDVYCDELADFAPDAEPVSWDVWWQRNSNFYAIVSRPAADAGTRDWPDPVDPAVRGVGSNSPVEGASDAESGGSVPGVDGSSAPQAAPTTPSTVRVTHAVVELDLVDLLALRSLDFQSSHRHQLELLSLPGRPRGSVHVLAWATPDDLVAVAKHFILLARQLDPARTDAGLLALAAQDPVQHEGALP